MDIPGLGENARPAIPTNEHCLPLLYIPAMQEKAVKPSFFCEKVTLGIIPMPSLKIG